MVRSLAYNTTLFFINICQYGMTSLNVNQQTMCEIIRCQWRRKSYLWLDTFDISIVLSMWNNRNKIHADGMLKFWNF